MSDDKKIINVARDLNTVTVIPVIARFNELLKTNDEGLAVLDFTDTMFVTPGGLTPMLAYLKELKQNDNRKFKVGLKSGNSDVDSYLRRMGFFSLLGLQDNYFFRKFTAAGRFQEPYYFTKDTDINIVTEKSSNIIETFIKERQEKNYNEAIGWCISEIIDNAHNHSLSDCNVVMAQKYKDGITEFCVADRGIGIRESMGEENTEIALKKCITKEKGKNSDGMGNGLYYTTELIKRDKSNKCYMSIWSEDYQLTLNSNSQPEVKKVEGYWQGASICISMYNGLSTSLSEIMNGAYSFSYENMPEYYDKLFND